MKEFIYFAPVIGVLAALIMCVMGISAGFFGNGDDARVRGWELSAIGAFLGIVSAMLL